MRGAEGDAAIHLSSTQKVDCFANARNDGANGQNWWKNAALLQKAGLYIFAALPVASNNLPQGTAPVVALAAVAPEDSGDDISYFLRGDKLETVDGFTNTREHAVFLGAHPRPIKLEKQV